MRFQEVFSWSVLLVFIVNSVNVSMKKYNNIEYIVVDMTDNHAHPEWLPIAIIPVNSFHDFAESSQNAIMNSEDKFNHLNQIFNSKTNQKHIKIRQLIQDRRRLQSGMKLHDEILTNKIEKQLVSTSDVDAKTENNFNEFKSDFEKHYNAVRKLHNVKTAPEFNWIYAAIFHEFMTEVITPFHDIPCQQTPKQEQSNGILLNLSF